VDEYKEQFITTYRSIPKVKDSVSLGLLGGLIGTLVLDFFNLIFWKKRKNESLYGQLAGSILMKGVRTKKTNNFIFGEIIHLLTGVLAGIPLVFLFKKTGKDNHLIKGASYGALIWMVYYVLGIKMDIFISKPKLNKTHYSSLWQNILYGMVTAKSIVSFAHPTVFPSGTGDALRKNKDKTAANANNFDAWTLPHYTDYDTEKPIH